MSSLPSRPTGPRTGDARVERLMVGVSHGAERAMINSPEVDFVRTGPGTFAGRYSRRFWQPVALSQEVRSGEARPLRILGEDFTLYPGESGTAHLVAHRCPHRLSQLSAGWVEQ